MTVRRRAPRPDLERMTEPVGSPFRMESPVPRTAKGFTLIELVIVVVIVGILAAIGIPNYVAMKDRAKEGAVKANMLTFQKAAEDYSVTANGDYAMSADSVAARSRWLREPVRPLARQGQRVGGPGLDLNESDRREAGARELRRLRIRILVQHQGARP